MNLGIIILLYVNKMYLLFSYIILLFLLYLDRATLRGARKTTNNRAWRTYELIYMCNFLTVKLGIIIILLCVNKMYLLFSYNIYCFLLY